MPSERILIVDDDPRIRAVLQEMLTIHKFEVECACDGFKALDLAAKEDYPLAIVDLSMPGLSGTEAIRRLRAIRPRLEVIIHTGNPSVETSVEAIREQVFDYLCKPCDMSQMLHSVRKALEHRRLVLENQDLLQQLQAKRQELEQEVGAAKRAIEHSLRNSAGFLGESAAAEEIRHHVASVAPSNVSILLLGESGTGKDVIAQLIHQASGRDGKPFVKVNCPAIPESLLESELFGHEAGSFTGATKRKPGRFELASGGTLFLDEIGDLPFALQAKLLQSVEQKQFYSVGGKKPIHVDARIIAATNAHLSDMMAQGKFRADLFYRLNEYSIRVPPLRERKDDMLLLSDHFLSEFRKQFSCEGREFSPEDQAWLYRHDWPGNVRELQSVIRRFALTGRLDLVQRTLGKKQWAMGPNVFRIPSDSVSGQFRSGGNGNGEIAELTEALSDSQWNRRKTAKILGISYSTLRRRIAKYNLTSAGASSAS